MTNQYLSLKQAIETTGVSEPTLRRLARKAKKHQKKYVDGKLHFLDSFLFESYPPIKVSNSVIDQVIDHPTTQPYQAPITADNALVDEKDNHIFSLREQLASKDKIIDDLNERLREANINLNTMQQVVQKALPSHQEQKKDVTQRYTLGDKILYGLALVTTLVLLVFFSALIYSFFRK